jgi:Ni2+-binding GTPase involved in maturation of urease and hydrogenase
MSLAYLLQDKTVITVSGSHSGIGKTLLAESILQVVRDFAAIKITIEDFFTAVSFDDATILMPGKDTCRLKTSGATQVVWVRTPEQHLVETMEQAVSVMKSVSGLLIEGNSITTYLEPDLAFFVFGGEIQTMKPSRLYALRRAQVIINNIRDADIDCRQNEKTLREINDRATVLSTNLAAVDTLQPILRNIVKQHLGTKLLRESTG